MNRTLLISLFIFFITASCEQREGNPVGACVHHYEDPILAIESVNDANSGEQISEITITDVRIDSVSQKVSSLVQESSNNVAVEDSSIVCKPPCGFGTKAGQYQFTVQASSYKDTTISKENVAYKNFDGGCPSSNSGSTTITFELQSSDQ